jgi:hypothetical protein
MAKDNAIYSNNLNDKMHKKVINANKNAKNIYFWGKPLAKWAIRREQIYSLLVVYFFFPI